MTGDHQAELSSLQQRIVELEQRVIVWREQAARYREIAEMFFVHTYAVRVEEDGSFIRELDREGLKKLTGFSEEEIIERDRQGLVHPEDVQLLLGRSEPLVAGRRVEGEYRIATKSGAYIRVRDISLPVWDAAQGRVIRIIGGIQVIEQQSDSA